MIIRNAEISDAVEIASLTLELGYPAAAGETATRLARLLARDDQYVTVAVTGGRVSGWIQAHASETLETGFRVEIVGLVVSQRSRRLGIGRKLVESAEAWASSKGAAAIVVRSNTTRLESHQFYPALGFSASKTQSVYRKPLAPTPE